MILFQGEGFNLRYSAVIKPYAYIALGGWEHFAIAAGVSVLLDDGEVDDIGPMPGIHAEWQSPTSLEYRNGFLHRWFFDWDYGCPGQRALTLLGFSLKVSWT